MKQKCLNIFFFDKTNLYNKTEIIANSLFIRKIMTISKEKKIQINFSHGSELKGNQDLILFGEMTLKLFFKLIFKYRKSKKILYTPENIYYRVSFIVLINYKFPLLMKKIFNKELLMKIISIKLIYLKNFNVFYVFYSRILNIKNNFIIVNNKINNYKRFFYYNYNSNHEFDNSRDFLNKLENIKHTKKIPKKFCAFIVSNPENIDRIIFFKKLSKYKKVDSYGKILQNKKTPNKLIEKYKDRHYPRNKINIDIFKEYKFVISIENTYNKDHITEKIVNAFLGNSIPIYKGAPNIGDYFNTESFINLNKYNSFNAAIKKIIELDKNEDKYLEMRNNNKISNLDFFKDYDEKFEKFIKDNFL